MGLLQFFFDKTGGNRIDQFYAAAGTTLLPQQPLYGFGEVLYASAAQYWGWAGLVAFTLIMFSPVILLLWDPAVLNHPVKRAALKGLMIYIVMGVIDGALDFIPVMAFYWFVYAVYLYGWPGFSERVVRAVSSPPAQMPEPDRGRHAGPLVLDNPRTLVVLQPLASATLNGSRNPLLRCCGRSACREGRSPPCNFHNPS